MGYVAMENLTIRIRPTLRARVEARAARLGVRPADLYRQYLEAGDAADQRREARTAARQAAAVRLVGWPEGGQE